MTYWVPGMGLTKMCKSIGRTVPLLYMNREVKNIQYCKLGARVLTNLGAPLATKLTYKMRSGGNGMWGRGTALYVQSLLF
jgi:hypothetical protein